ncbi:hypothetical protein CLAIMM_03771 [Cladophialophora immunda]|nr:hypothetical protein CLAIMM_03771 [Cladophialophora immunda]
MRYFTLILSLSALAAASSSLGSNFTSTDCASSSGFDKCFSAAQNKATKCIDDGDGSDAIDIACTCVMWLDEINCAVSNCWNEVYSCQYQALIIRYMTFCPTSQDGFPFFPAPDNAPGGCSCNIGQVYLNAANSYTESTKCSSPSSVDGEIACICCMEASAYSSVAPTWINMIVSLISLRANRIPDFDFGKPNQHAGQRDTDSLYHGRADHNTAEWQCGDLESRKLRVYRDNGKSGRGTHSGREHDDDGGKYGRLLDIISDRSVKYRRSEPGT